MDKLIPEFKVFLIVILISIFLLIADFFKLLSIPKGLVSYITNPISFGLFNTNKNIARQFHFIFQARFASQEAKALKEQIAKLLSENAKIRKDLAESQALISQQESLPPQTYNLVVARPIGLGRYLKIDKGSESGIKIGDAAVSNENLIGRIISVSERASNVALLADPDSKVAAFSQGLEGKAKGILIGEFGTDIILDKILHEEKINVDDLVYTEGTEGNLPRGLILGKVTEVLDLENEVFKKAKVESIFDISYLDLVFVIKE